MFSDLNRHWNPPQGLLKTPRASDSVGLGGAHASDQFPGEVEAAGLGARPCCSLGQCSLLLAWREPAPEHKLGNHSPLSCPLSQAPPGRPGDAGLVRAALCLSLPTVKSPTLSSCNEAHQGSSAWLPATPGPHQPFRQRARERRSLDSGALSHVTAATARPLGSRTHSQCSAVPAPLWDQKQRFWHKCVPLFHATLTCPHLRLSLLSGQRSTFLPCLCGAQG